MLEFIVSWSAYGPSGRIEAETQDEATVLVRAQLELLGLDTEVRREDAFAGDFVILRSRVKRYGDMASFGVCVYPVGGHSWYDADREQRQLMAAQEGAH